jgi:hypothetical protein
MATILKASRLAKDLAYAAGIQLIPARQGSRRNSRGESILGTSTETYANEEAAPADCDCFLVRAIGSGLEIGIITESSCKGKTGWGLWRVDLQRSHGKAFRLGSWRFDAPSVAALIREAYT